MLGLLQHELLAPAGALGYTNQLYSRNLSAQMCGETFEMLLAPRCLTQERAHVVLLRVLQQVGQFRLLTEDAA